MENASTLHKYFFKINGREVLAEELVFEIDDDPKLITEPKTFHIQRISILFGLKDSLPFLSVTWGSPITDI